MGVAGCSADWRQPGRGSCGASSLRRVVAAGVALGARRSASWRAGGALVATAREEQGQERRERAREREKKWRRPKRAGGGG
jgi:hypothetical protein